MEIKKIIREIKYKGHCITKFEDPFGQWFVIIDNDTTDLFDSIIDAKRVINGEERKYVIQ